MFDPQNTMLPQSATPLARAMDVLEERLLSLPVGMLTKDPGSVPAALLDHLAWEESADVWDIDWPEEVKRNVIALAAEVHRHKGTPYAVRRALEAFDVRAEILEWWQDADPAALAGTFKATVYVGRSLSGDTEVYITARIVRAMRAVIERTAPVSRGFTLLVGANLRAMPVAIAAHASAVQTATFRMAVVQQGSKLPASLAVGAHAASLQMMRVRMN